MLIGCDGHMPWWSSFLATEVGAHLPEVPHFHLLPRGQAQQRPCGGYDEDGSIHVHKGHNSSVTRQGPSPHLCWQNKPKETIPYDKKQSIEALVRNNLDSLKAPCSHVAYPYLQRNQTHESILVVRTVNMMCKGGVCSYIHIMQLPDMISTTHPQLHTWLKW